MITQLSIRLKPMKKALWLLITIGIFTACGHNSRQVQDSPANKLEYTSSSIDSLSHLLNFKQFKPIKVKYHYILFDNSKGFPPAPSDSYLDGVLYFPDSTLQKIRKLSLEQGPANVQFTKDEFKSELLNDAELSELQNSDEKDNAFPDKVFMTFNGKIWILDHAVIVTYSNN